MKKLYKNKKSMISLLVFTLVLMTILTTSLFTSNIFGATTVDYKIQNDWGSGSSVTVTIYNTGSTAINGWTVNWTFPGNQQISSLWNGSYTQTGTSVSVSNVAWNSSIPANGSVSFGFNLTYSGTNEAPSDFVVNGVSDTVAATTAPRTTAMPTATTGTTTTAVTTTTPEATNSTSSGGGDAQIILNSSSISVNGSGAIASGNKVTITSAGLYTVSGTILNGTIIVDTVDEEKVEITLNGANITSSNSSPINIKSGEVILTLVGSNSVTDGTFYVYDDATNEEPNSTIFSKDDLTINGTGTLTVRANFNDGINCNDDFKISSGTINVTSVDDGLVGNESIEVNGGNITVNSKGDCLKVTEEVDTEKGYLQIDGGTLKLTSSGSDGLKAYRLVEVNDGSLNITANSQAIKSDIQVVINGGTLTVPNAYEGIESTYIQINGGNLSIYASDDGINATRNSTGSTVLIEVNGGTINVTVGSGDTDAFDSNGNITINDGIITVVAPTSAFDADGTAVLNGGTVTVNGQVVTQLTQQGGGRTF